MISTLNDFHFSKKCLTSKFRYKNTKCYQIEWRSDGIGFVCSNIYVSMSYNIKNFVSAYKELCYDWKSNPYHLILRNFKHKKICPNTYD